MAQFISYDEDEDEDFLTYELLLETVFENPDTPIQLSNNPELVGISAADINNFIIEKCTRAEQVEIRKRIEARVAVLCSVMAQIHRDNDLTLPFSLEVQIQVGDIISEVADIEELTFEIPPEFNEISPEFNIVEFGGTRQKSRRGRKSKKNKKIKNKSRRRRG